MVTVLAAPTGASLTGATVIAIVSVSVNAMPASSVVRMVNVSEPLKLVLPV